ncbi:MAG: DUF5343 domain-containing protein [Chloroflexi bacterium]|nr:DUF5343 domain-containing protein [Chloroflexota bacterium]
MTERASRIPPYVPYRTFRNFLDILKEGIPARIDRSVWGERFSGSNGTQLMTALKVLGLIDEQGQPGADLERLVRFEGDARRDVWRAVLRRRYAPLFSLDLQRATRAQFRDAFRAFGTNDAVLARCERFFVQAAQDGGVELSPYILDRRRGPRRQPGSRPRGIPPQSSNVPVARNAPAAESERSIAAMILEKYPPFDPRWEPNVQIKWLEGITRLYDGLRAAEAAPG